MGIRDTYHLALVRACMVAGDETELARRLGVPVELLVMWLLGDKPVPPEIFLRAVDLVIDSHTEHVEAVRVFLENVRRRHNKRDRG
jgi:DNA-binding transcriptional regulator YdaS (Cro superfamily)